MFTVQRRAQSEVKTQVDQLCASFPFFLGLIGSGRLRISLSEEEIKVAISKTTASTAFLLVWPMTIASAAAKIPEEQRHWIKAKIFLLGQITGNGVLAAVAKV
jgi:hypothetical protein